MRHLEAVVAASFSPDGQRVVTASSDRTARVWEALTGQALGPPLSHQDQILAACFSPDGQRVVTASVDGTAQVWDVAVDWEGPLPKWLPDLAEALGGKRLDETGHLVSPQTSLPQLRQELLALEATNFWSRLGRWFFLRGPARTFSPTSELIRGEL